MSFDKQHLQQHYKTLTDDALLEIYDQNSLVDEAKPTLVEELESRNILPKSNENIQYTSEKDINRAMMKQKISIFLWRIFWRVVFPFLVILALVYGDTLIDWFWE